MNNKNTFIQMGVKSPFTSVYPRYNSWHAIQALNQLDEFIVLDTETTGIGKQAEVCEIAIVDFRSGDVLLNTLIQPKNLDGYEVSKAREINGISQADLLFAPTLFTVWPEVLRILQSKHVTVFNADFDLKMVRNSAQKWGVDVPPFAATCLMKLVTAFLSLDYWLSLDEAAEYFGIATNSRHRALGDVLTTIEIIKRIKVIAQIAR